MATLPSIDARKRYAQKVSHLFLRQIKPPSDRRYMRGIEHTFNIQCGSSIVNRCYSNRYI